VFAKRNGIHIDARRELNNDRICIRRVRSHFPYFKFTARFCSFFGFYSEVRTRCRSLFINERYNFGWTGKPVRARLGAREYFPCNGSSVNNHYSTLNNCLSSAIPSSSRTFGSHPKSSLAFRLSASES